jgi:putative ABC transport system permease protein
MARYAGKVQLYGRLKPGVSREAALGQLRAIERRFIDEHATPAVRAQAEDAGLNIELAGLGEDLATAASRPLGLLQIGSAFVLFIGTINVVSLMLARGNTKRPEYAVRLALGAGRGALFRQFLAENVLLTLVAALGGIFLGWAAIKLTNVYLPMVAAGARPVTLEPKVIALVSAGLLILGATMAALQLGWLCRSGLNLEGARTTSAGRRARWFSGGLVTAQIAVAVVLLIGAGLLLRSFAQVVAVDPGFNPAQLVQGRIAVSKRYSDPEKNVALQRRVRSAILEIPGVQQVALVDVSVVGSFRATPFVLRGSEVPENRNRLTVAVNPVSPEFFETMQIRLLEGRFFTEADDLRKSFVVIVDDLFAKRYFPDTSPIDREISFSSSPPPEGQPWPRIIGVVKRAQLAGLEARDGMPFVYWPMVQQPVPGFTIIARSSRPASAVLAEIRQKLRAIDPLIPLYWAASIEETFDGMLQHRRGLLVLTSIFAGLALILAAVGLYGVLAYDVSQRTREIGIRNALGATRRQIIGLIMRQGLSKTLIGLSVGLVGAMCLARFMRGLLFEIGHLDPVAFCGVLLLLLLIAVIASWVPARRAAKVDPMVALRAE